MPDDPQALNLAKSIRRAETGGSTDPYNQKGASGEFGAYQFMPETYKNYAHKYLGDAAAQPTVENQNKIAYSFVKEKKDAGYNPAQIASMWNAGEGKPNAYKENYKGTNAEGVSYDTPAYAEKVSKYYHELSGTQTPSLAQAQPQKEPGFLENEANSLSSRITQGGNAIADTLSGKINPLSGILQTAGAAAGGITDLAGNALGALTPDAIKKPVEGAVQGLIGAAQKTPLGQSITQGVSDFSDKHPELSADIGAVGNIAGVIPITSGIGAVKDLAGGLLGRAAGKSALSETIDAISPEIKAGTKAGAANVSRAGTSKSILGTITRNADPSMVEAAPVIKANIPGFDKLPTFSEKLAAIQDDAIPKEAQTLRKALTSDEVQSIINPDNYGKFLKDIDTAIQENPSLVGDSGEYARRFLKVFQNQLPKEGDITMENVLDARQALDDAALRFKPKAFDPARVSAYSDGLRAVRNAANTLLDESAPNAGVKAALRRQALLYRAAENLATKADKEVGTGVIGRAIKRHPHLTRAAKYSGSALLGGLGIGEAQNLLGK